MVWSNSCIFLSAPSVGAVVADDVAATAAAAVDDDADAFYIDRLHRYISSLALSRYAIYIHFNLD